MKKITVRYYVTAFVPDACPDDPVEADEWLGENVGRFGWTIDGQVETGGPDDIVFIDKMNDDGTLADVIYERL